MAKAKPILGIDWNGPTVFAIVKVLGARMEEMCAFRENALESSDPEGVHDMRVASRRLRTVLRDFERYLGKRRFADSLENIKALARALGRVRDHDVAIITLKKTAAKAPPEISAGVLRLAEIRHKAREQAFAELAQVLECDALSRLKAKFEKALDATLERAHKKHHQSAADPTALTYRELAQSTILSHLKELEEHSESLYRPNKVKPLHRARISAKNLRYALELFDQGWEEQGKFFAKKLSALQSALGELHDCDVRIESFGDEAIKDLRTLDVNQNATSVWLLLHFVKLRSKYFHKALQHWNDWESDGLSHQLRTIIMNHGFGGIRMRP